MNINSLVVHDGYAAVGALILAESLGVPLPGETILIAAATYAGETHHLGIVAIVGVAICAGIVGNAIGYLIGRLIGWPLLVRYGPRIKLSEERIKLLWYLFNRQGIWVVGLGRFVSVLRTYVALIAGCVEMGPLGFMAASIGANVVWATLFGVGAYELGHTLTKVATILDVIVGVGFVIAIAASWIFVRHHIRRLTERAQEAFPGPLSHTRPTAAAKGSN